MSIKTIILTLILVIGFTFQNCNPVGNDDDAIYCQCPPFEGDYFDIQGIELINYKKGENCCLKEVSENQELSFSEYDGLTIDYLVEYHSTNCPKKSFWNFSLMNTALACSCLNNGWNGSKEEKIKSLTVLSINDFDEEHLANDTINELLNARIEDQVFDLQEYLAQDSSKIRVDELTLILKKAPELNNEFKVKVSLELSTNERYDSESKAIKIIN